MTKALPGQAVNDSLLWQHTKECDDIVVYISGHPVE